MIRLKASPSGAQRCRFFGVRGAIYQPNHSANRHEIEGRNTKGIFKRMENLYGAALFSANVRKVHVFRFHTRSGDTFSRWSV